MGHTNTHTYTHTVKCIVSLSCEHITHTPHIDVAVAVNRNSKAWLLDALGVTSYSESVASSSNGMRQITAKCKVTGGKWRRRKWRRWRRRRHEVKSEVQKKRNKVKCKDDDGKVLLMWSSNCLAHHTPLPPSLPLSPLHNPTLSNSLTPHSCTITREKLGHVAVGNWKSTKTNKMKTRFSFFSFRFVCIFRFCIRLYPGFGVGLSQLNHRFAVRFRFHFDSTQVKTVSITITVHKWKRVVAFVFSLFSALYFDFECRN